MKLNNKQIWLSVADCTAITDIRYKYKQEKLKALSEIALIL